MGKRQPSAPPRGCEKSSVQTRLSEAMTGKRDKGLTVQMGGTAENGMKSFCSITDCDLYLCPVYPPSVSPGTGSFHRVTG